MVHDSAGRKADLRLDQRDAAIESGAIAPGEPDSSAALDRIFSDDPDEVMPPPAVKKTLTAAQKDLLLRWIKYGARSGRDAHYPPGGCRRRLAQQAITPSSTSEEGLGVAVIATKLLEGG